MNKGGITAALMQMLNAGAFGTGVNNPKLPSGGFRVVSGIKHTDKKANQRKKAKRRAVNKSRRVNHVR